MLPWLQVWSQAIVTRLPVSHEKIIVMNSRRIKHHQSIRIRQYNDRYNGYSINDYTLNSPLLTPYITRVCGSGQSPRLILKYWHTGSLHVTCHNGTMVTSQSRGSRNPSSTNTSWKFQILYSQIREWNHPRWKRYQRRTKDTKDDRQVQNKEQLVLEIIASSLWR